MVDTTIRAYAEFQELVDMVSMVLEDQKESIEVELESVVWDVIESKHIDQDTLDDVYNGAKKMYFIDLLNRQYGLEIPVSYFEDTTTFEELLVEINRMIKDNNSIKVSFDPRDISKYFVEHDGVDTSVAMLNGTVKDFISNMTGFYNQTNGETLSVSLCLKEFIRSLGIYFSPDELQQIDKTKTMTEVYQIFEKKIKTRKPNDCKTRYGNIWSVELRSKTIEWLTEKGGYPLGLPMKHIGKYDCGKLTAYNIGAADIGVYEMPGHFKILIDSNVILEYASLEELLDDGWVVD